MKPVLTLPEPFVSPVWDDAMVARWIGKRPDCHRDTLLRWADKYAKKAYMGNGRWRACEVMAGAKAEAKRESRAEARRRGGKILLTGVNGGK